MKKLINKNKGCYAENLAVCYLQEKGYFVFKGCQTQSAIDLITVDPKTFKAQYYDVKTLNHRKDGSEIYRVPRIKDKGIHIILVDISKKICKIVKYESKN